MALEGDLVWVALWHFKFLRGSETVEEVLLIVWIRILGDLLRLLVAASLYPQNPLELKVSKRVHDRVTPEGCIQKRMFLPRAIFRIFRYIYVDGWTRRWRRLRQRSHGTNRRKNLQPWSRRRRVYNSLL